jgi:hypothetical protein
MHPDDPTRLICHETICAAIYAQPKGGLKAEMIAALRQYKPVRGLRRTTLAGGSIAPECDLRPWQRPSRGLQANHCRARDGLAPGAGAQVEDRHLARTIRTPPSRQIAKAIA